MTGEQFVDKYARRRELNEASRFWAVRNNEAWTADDDDILLEYWIKVDPSQRSEVEVSQAVGRTIESCRVRCEIIRKRLGLSIIEVKRTVITTAQEVCPECWLVHPEGACDR